MPEIDTLLSQRESEAVKQYAKQVGVSEEEIIGRLAMDNLARRLRTRKKQGEVKPFRLPESD